MNNRTTFALLAVLTAVSTLTVSSAYAQLSCPDCGPDDPRIIAQQLLLEDIPISLWTDKSTYDHNDSIIVEGRVANVNSGVPVTLTVMSSLNSIISIDQVSVDDMGNFRASFSTAGDLWKYDGTYYIKANYGSAQKNNKVLVELVNGINARPDVTVTVAEFFFPFIKGRKASFIHMVPLTFISSSLVKSCGDNL